MSELLALGVDFGRLADAAVSRARPVIERAALNIKRQMSAEMAASQAFHGTARSVSYDMRSLAGGIKAEIGPDKNRRGSLANVAYFGGSRGGGGTVPDPLLALLAEEPALLRYLGDVIEEV